MRGGRSARREMCQVVTSAVKKKKHRWGECPRDRKEAAHVEDRGQREVRAGRAGQRQATR